MYINGFRIGFDKSKRLWLIVLGAVTIAIVLIITAFVKVYNSDSNEFNNSNDFDIKNITSYSASYILNVKSNKNQNNYHMEEEYKKEEENDFFRFNVVNGDEIIVYTFDQGTLNIKSNKQNLSYTLSDYLVKKENIISIATFFELYKNIDVNKDKGFGINIEEQDNKVTYKININLDDETLSEYEFLKNISKLEVVIDKEENKICEYIIYDNNGNAYIDIMYDKFLIND